MRVVFVSGFYSHGMGYTENALPRALAARGHDVHVVTSDLNVYADTANYALTYEAFLGPARQTAGVSTDGAVTVHRLGHRTIGGYISLPGLAGVMDKLSPDVVHVTEIASLQAFKLAALHALKRWPLFAETHQHLSVIKPYMLDPNGNKLKRAVYRLTRTLPTALASLAVEKCYAIAPDCVEVARRFYGVASHKLKLQNLGTDTVLFHPIASAAAKAALRQPLGLPADEPVFIYTGRFSAEKNPLLLAKAVAQLRSAGVLVRGFFVGAGEQHAAIAAKSGCHCVPFVKHDLLAEYYRLSDVAVWPTQESMSMLDAAASGLPLIVSADIGDPGRVAGSGETYQPNSVDSMTQSMRRLLDPARRATYGAAGRSKMIENYSWDNIARAVENDYLEALP